MIIQVCWRFWGDARMWVASIIGDQRLYDLIEPTRSGHITWLKEVGLRDTNKTTWDY